MDSTFEEYFKQQTLSDAELIIHVTHNRCLEQQQVAQDACKHMASDQQQMEHQQLATFPVHQVFLLKSEFFKAQTRLWPSKEQHSSGAPEPTAAAAAGPVRPTLKLTIDSADQLPAAEAVIAALYGGEKHLAGLEQRQLLSAVLIADRVHVPAAVKHAVWLLIQAALSEGGLTTGAQEALASLYPWPTCLLPLLPAVVAAASCCSPDLSTLRVIQTLDTGNRIQRMLTAVFGDLEAVWRDQQLKQLLLQLPLPALQLLLSSDQLRVSSEDTVLYTAAAYKHMLEPEAARAAAAALAPLIRCPHLSGFALKWATLSMPIQQGPAMVLAQYEQQLKLLLSAHSVVHVGAAQQAAAAAAAAAADMGASSATYAASSSTGDSRGTAPYSVFIHPLSTLPPAAAAAAETGMADSASISVVREMPDAPDSWKLPPRQIMSHHCGVTHLWKLPVSTVMQACQESISKQKSLCLESSESAPLGGLCWQMRLVCEVQPDGSSVMLGMYVEPAMIVAGIFYKLQFTFVCHQGEAVRHELLTPWVNVSSGYGDDDFFGVGAMAGGWDRDAWIAKGLPTTGDLDLEMHLHTVW